MHFKNDSGVITVVGSLNYDMICVLQRLPQMGETLTARSYVTAFGGKGANQAVAAARMGARVRMIGAVGRDTTGEAMRHNLESQGVDITGIKSVDVPSGIAMINVAASGDNTIVVYPGANAGLNPAWVRQNEESIRASSCLVMQLEVPIESVLEAAGIARDAGVPILLNPAPARELPAELLSACSIITPNQTELRLLSGVEDLEAGARVMLDRGIASVVVTLGKEGSLYMDEHGSFTVPSFPVSAIDATAAGDTFNGALATRLSGRRGQPMDADDLSFCNAAGALAATKLGAQPSIPTLAEVLAFMKR